MSFNAKLIVMAAMCLAVLSGCGQRGPLYLPEQVPAEPAAEAATSATTPPAAEDAGPAPDTNTDDAADEEDDAER